MECKITKNNELNVENLKKKIKKRIMIDKSAKLVFLLSALFALLVLGILIYRIFTQSIGWLDIQFLTSKLSIFPEKAGIFGAIVGSFLLMVIVAPVTIILGVSTAIYLEEYSSKGRLQTLIKTNISNLAGVPSVIFGLLGLTVFGRLLNLGSSILAGGLTMSLLVLPIVVVASQEAIRAVPGFLRDASYAMGASKWTTISRVVLPVALPGILTGSILALSRAIGETAPLVVLGIPTLILKIPQNIMDDFTALPIQIYYWTLDTVLTAEYANLAAATIVVLLLMLFTLNSIAIIIRNKFQRRY
ncbi:phosphate ABC transporter permease PstA [Alkaliphilus serpentinus]|uniref:Phosphate transport system permease protein PstA n=1 Tax=Alkaliphilus serpentinus TaxID=1482731 RepID=A0A833MAK6_9FIRM|nr:phosphate ABC transporter permease PstA [Alkaliphilus serpentinus]KAB3532499.1 phosphate ABC transporter permease PstA [Alkaliphilus serpentinus]